MQEINVVEVFQLLLKKIWLLILVTVVCAAIGFSYCKFLAIPEYTANAKVVITTGGILTNENIENPSKVTAADVSTSLAMLETYAITLDMFDMYYMVLEDIKDEVTDTYTAGTLKDITSYKYVDTSLVIAVVVTCTNQEDARIIANSVAKYAPKYLQQFFPTTSAMVVEYSEKASLSYPNTLLTTFISGVAGCIAVAAIICIAAFTDRTIKDENHLTNLGLTVIGIVPDFNTLPKGGYYRHD